MTGYIYKIINKKNGHFYIGSTLNWEKRKHSHLYSLRNNRHHCIHLQKAFKQYGEECFEFLMLKEYTIETEKEIRELEERYISFCWNSGLLYNCSKTAGGGDNITTLPKEQYEELRIRKSESSKKMWEQMTEEQRKERSNNLMGEKNPNYNNRWNEQQRKHMSEYRKEYYKEHPSELTGKTYEEIFGEEKAKELKSHLSEVSSKKTGEKNPFYGRHHSDKTKKIISEKNKGKVCPTKKKVVYKGKIYDSATVCAKELGIQIMTVAYRCRQRIYGFAYYEEGMDINNIVDTATSHKPYTTEEIYELASNFRTKQEFRNAYPSVVECAKRKGIWDDICKKYFIELRHYWSKEEILELAKKYDSIDDFKRNEKKAYSSIRWNNWFDEF